MNVWRFTLIALLMLGLASLGAAQVAPLTITSTSLLPSGVVGETYNQTFEATGGTGVYAAWAVTTGTLPAGLSLNSTTAVLTGTPTQAGTSTFTVRVTDSAQNTASQQFTLTVWVTPPPVPRIDFISNPNVPAPQVSLYAFIRTAYPLTVTGTLRLTFEPNATAAADDPAIQFAGGGRTLNFTIEAGKTSATFDGTPAFQKGTVAGTITITITQLQAGGQDCLPNPDDYDTSWYLTITRSAPVITSAQVSKETPGFSVQIRGYSTPREMTQATFVFTALAPIFQVPNCTPSSSEACRSQTSSFVVPLDSVFGAWYGGSSSTPFGSQFLYTQLFAVQGDVNAISSVSVTLQNSSGTSAAVRASF